MKYTILLFSILLFTSCKKDKQESVAPETGSFRLDIQTQANDETFHLNKAFATVYDDSLWCETLNFFITNIKLKRKGSNEFVTLQDQFFLFRQSELEKDSTSRVPMLATGVAIGEYDQLSFNIGIPLEKNHEPNYITVPIATDNSMYWEAWTEHIFFRFEGKFGPQKKAYLYHVTGDENLKTIIIPLKNSPLVINKAQKPVVPLTFHVDKVFSAMDKIDINTNYNHMSGTIVARMANNYGKCFSLNAEE